MTGALSNWDVPRFSQPEALRATGIPPATLQTWVARKLIKLAEQNPGSGRRRLYSANDIVRLAVMRQAGEAGLSIERSRWLDDLARSLVTQARSGSGPWILIQPAAGPAIVRRRGEVLAEVFHELTDLMSSLSDLLEGDYQMVDFATPEMRVEMKRPAYKKRAIMKSQRLETWQGGPIIVFPLGKIVDDTLQRLRSLQPPPLFAPQP